MPSEPHIRKFQFATAARIIFGCGASTEIAPEAAAIGRRAFVLTGSDQTRIRKLLQQLNDAGLDCVLFAITAEPTTDLVDRAFKQAANADCDVVIGIGGGSVIDAGKAVAALLTNGGTPTDYLEVVGLGKPVAKQPAPYIAVPTTAGTGAEVTKNSVLAVPEHKVKVSMRSDMMLPRLAVVDPELTISMPPAVTASTGLDALTQLIEAFVSNKANPLTDGICREGIRRAAASLERACNDGRDISARQDMAVAGLFGGLALANAKLGAVHGFAGPLGGRTGAPHGVICARFLPHVIRVNVEALRQSAKNMKALTRYEELASLLVGSGASIDDGVKWIERLCGNLQVPSLRKFGLCESNFEQAVAKAKRASSMKGNPIALTDGQLHEILAAACT